MSMITYQRVVIIIVRHFYTTTCKNTLQHSSSHPIPAQHVCECPTIKLQSYRQPTGHQVLHHRRRRRFLFFFPGEEFDALIVGAAVCASTFCGDAWRTRATQRWNRRTDGRTLRFVVVSAVRLVAPIVLT